MEVQQTKLTMRDRLWWFRRTTVPRFFRESVPHFAARAVPRRVRYWILIDAWCKATPGDVHPDRVRMRDAIKHVE